MYLLAFRVDNERGQAQLWPELFGNDRATLKGMLEARHGDLQALVHEATGIEVLWNAQQVFVLFSFSLPPELTSGVVQALNDLRALLTAGHVVNSNQV